MIKYLFIIFPLFYSSVFSQTTDTLINVPDSLAVDTLFVITNNDSLFVNDSTKVPDEIVKPDSLIPIQGIPLTDASQIINKRTFLFYNYRYTGDFLRLFPLNFVKDLGFMGQPNETFVYGAGAGGVSFMEDGVLWNNRFTNALDLNHIQSEDIDSIEIVPSPRGFLYGPFNNPVTVNFIMRDFLSPEPYSRIKYYEGPDGEAMFDGKFNAQIAKKWNLSFQLTNRSTDSSFVNNEFSIWQVNTKLKYYLSNSINLSAIYSFVNAGVGLNGGVDVDSIAKITNDINSILYDGQSAPVVYPNRSEGVVNHNFRLRVQTLSFDGSKLDLSFYYKYGKNEITNELDTIKTRDKFENKTLGSTINYGQKVGILTAKIYGSFERNSLLTTYENKEVSTKTTDFTYISAGGVLSAGLLSGKLVPSIFYKYFNQNYTEFGKGYVNSNSGLGADLFYKVFNNLSIYAGYSMYNQFDFGDARNFEISAKYNDEVIFFNMKYFERKNFIPYSVAIPLWTGIEMGIPKQEIKGVGVKASVKFWKLLLETNNSYYFNADDYQLIGVPELQFVGGVFLNGFFFDDNLFLKAGVQFYYTGTNNVYSDVWRGIIVVEPSNKVDITITGEIKGVAIVYLGLENLFGNQYFITPYYPMQGRNFRFGLSWELFN